MKDSEFIKVVARLLKGQSTIALATTADDGSARVAPLFYISDDELRLYWFSSPGSEHSRNLARNSAAAVCVYRPTEQWKEIIGVQMHGTVSVVADRERRRSIEKEYTERFHLGKLFEAQIALNDLYVFQPTWVRYIDSSKYVGHKIERMV